MKFAAGIFAFNVLPIFGEGAGAVICRYQAMK